MSHDDLFRTYDDGTMKTIALVCPFAQFGSPGAAEGAELLADAIREMLDDNRRERRPTRGRAYQPHVRIKELEFADLAAVGAWRETARRRRRARVSGLPGRALGGRGAHVLPQPGA